MFTAGVKLAPLGSVQDRILREFMSRETERQMLSSKIIAYSALISASGEKAVKDDILDAWKKIVILSYGGELSSITSAREDTFAEEYAKYKEVFPRFKIDKKGDQIIGISIEGLTV